MAKINCPGLFSTIVVTRVSLPSSAIIDLQKPQSLLTALDSVTDNTTIELSWSETY